MIICPHELDVPLCSITVGNAALSFSLVGHLWPIRYQFKNKLRAIQPQNLGKIKKSQPEPQFHWFL